MKTRFKPIEWGDMPFFARKCWLRLHRINMMRPVNGWEWFIPLKDQSKIYAIAPSGTWFVGNTQ